MARTWGFLRLGAVQSIFITLIRVAAVSIPARAAAVFTSRVDDPTAVYLSAPEFGAHGDGAGDDSAATQSAIDKAVAGPERAGIVFIPSGRYRVTRTIYVWPGVRVIGYGATRPVLVLGADTPGFQTGVGDMVFFAGFKPGGQLSTRFRIPFPPLGTVPPNDSGAVA